MSGWAFSKPEHHQTEWEKLDLTGWFFIVGMSVAKKFHHKGVYAYDYTVVDEDWTPLPSVIRVHPNDNAAVNEARISTGRPISDGNPIICKLRRVGRDGVTIDSVVTDTQKLLELREKAVWNRNLKRKAIR